MSSQSTAAGAQRSKSATAIAVWLLGLTIFFAVAPMTAHARWYDPERGRFMSRDPAGFVDGPNVYQFVLNDPINFNDPTGEAALNVGGCIIGGACAAMLAWHANRCADACGTVKDTRRACTEDWHWYTQVYDTGQKDWGCIGKCILDGATSGWRGKVFMTVCGAAVSTCLSNLSGPEAGHWPGAKWHFHYGPPRRWWPPSEIFHGSKHWLLPW